MPLTKVTNSMIQGAEVCIFDFFSAAQIAAVQAQTYPDVTAEIVAALATGKNLYFPAGGYGHTGGLIQADNINKGQSVRGVGEGPNTGTNINATILKKLSGSLTGWRFDSDFATLENIRFDNGGLNGICLHISIHNSRARNIYAGNMNAATTDATIRFESVNLSSFDTIGFVGYNYLPIEFYDTGATLYGSLYSEYRNIIINTQGGNCVYGIVLSGVITNNFYNLVLEEPIRIENNTTYNEFYSLKSEALSETKSLISCSVGSENNSTNNFFGMRVNCQTAPRGTTPLFALNNLTNTNFYGLQVSDDVTAAPVIFYMNGMRQFSCRDATVSATNPYTFVQTYVSTYYCENIVLDNCNSTTLLGVASVVGTCIWSGYSRALSVSNTNMKQTFGNNPAISVPDYASVTLTNVTPGLNGVLVSAGYSHVGMTFINCKYVADDDGWAYLTNCTLQNGVYVGTGKAKSAVLTLTAAGSYTWTGVIPQSCIVKNVTLFNIADTGQTYNVGNANVGANQWGATVAKAVGTQQFSDNYTTLYPLYNPNNGADNLVLTATAGNFTAGSTVRACVVYEPLGFITA